MKPPANADGDSNTKAAKDKTIRFMDPSSQNLFQEEKGNPPEKASL